MKYIKQLHFHLATNWNRNGFKLFSSLIGNKLGFLFFLFFPPLVLGSIFVAAFKKGHVTAGEAEPSLC